MSIKDIVFGWQVGNQIMNLQMVKKHVDIPIEPMASMYLYGTPAQTTVTYNGVELPDIETVWTDKETYPYAVMSNAPESVSIQNKIGLADQVYQLMVSSSPTAVKSSGSGYRYHVSDAVAKRYIVLVNSAELDALMTENNVTDEDLETALGVSRRSWLLMNEYDLYEAGFPIDSLPTNWANHDILNEDGSTYLTATDPVHSGNIGLRSGESVTYYDGIVCSEIPSTPEGHTYAYIFRKLSNGRISARYFSHPLYQKENYIYCERDVGSTLRGSNYDPNTNSWSEPVWWSHSSNSNQEFPDDYRFDFYACLWANTDIVSDDGSVYLAATDPIQVGEIVDTINGIPIYEIKEAI